MKYLSRNEIKAEFEKVQKVILSCNTKDQLKVAKKYHDLWYEKYKRYIETYKSYDFMFMNGCFLGMFHGMLKFVK